MMGDLVERFRGFATQWVKGTLRGDEIYEFTDSTGSYIVRASDLQKAADRIEKLEAEVERLRRAWATRAGTVEVMDSGELPYIKIYFDSKEDMRSFDDTFRQALQETADEQR